MNWNVIVQILTGTLGLGLFVATFFWTDGRTNRHKLLVRICLGLTLATGVAGILGTVQSEEQSQADKKELLDSLYIVQNKLDSVSRDVTTIRNYSIKQDTLLAPFVALYKKRFPGKDTVEGLRLLKNSYTYNVQSHNQSGGITAGSIGDITIQDNSNAFLGVTNNYEIQVDTKNKLIAIWPKAGAWPKPIIAVLASEKDRVNQLALGSLIRVGMGITDMTDNLGNNISISYASWGSPIGSKDDPLMMSYHVLPSLIVFGAHGGKEMVIHRF